MRAYTDNRLLNVYLVIVVGAVQSGRADSKYEEENSPKLQTGLIEHAPR